MVNYLQRLLYLFLITIMLEACTNNGNIIAEINIGEHSNNVLKIEIGVTTTEKAAIQVAYWRDSTSNEKFSSLVSPEGLSHKIVLTNIIPNTDYSFNIITSQDGIIKTSKKYSFKSRVLPVWLQDQFKYSCTDSTRLPQEFKQGWMLLNKRETPGVAYIVDFKGNLKWYHTVDGTGFKVTHFTKDSSIISILGKNDEPTSYGSEILEVNLSGDTLTHLKKGQGDFKYTIHHEILKTNNNKIVTLYVDSTIRDLTSIGGTVKDSVNGDGILVMDKNGKKIWQWSVFDVVDPLKDPQLLKTRTDWMHANSLNYDADSNYIVSFYNNGQIWKIDAHSGKVLWKLGKGGTFALPEDCDFTQAHAVHKNAFGSLMFFDNGIEKKQSEVFSLKLDESNQTAAVDMHFKLPVDLYNDRMGSAYMIGDSAVLCCCSKKHMTVLTDRKGNLLWTLQTAIPPYRVEFLKKDQVHLY